MIDSFNRVFATLLEPLTIAGSELLRALSVQTLSADQASPFHHLLMLADYPLSGRVQSFSGSLALGALIAVTMLALGITVGLRRRHDFSGLGYVLSSLSLAVIALFQLSSTTTWEWSLKVVASLSLAFFAIDHTLTEKTSRLSVYANSVGASVAKFLQHLLLIAITGTVLFAPAFMAHLHVVLPALVTVTMIVLVVFSVWMWRHGNEGAIYYVANWMLMSFAFSRTLYAGSDSMNTPFIVMLVISNVLLMMTYLHRSLQIRQLWLDGLESSADATRLLSIERAYLDFSREVEKYLSSIEPDTYEETILECFLGNLGNVVPVSASAVIICHRENVRMVTRYPEGDSANFSQVLAMHENLLQSVCLSNQVAILHSSEFGISVDSDSISSLCIVPVRTMRNDWAGVVLARTYDSAFDAGEIRLTREFAELARDTIINARKISKVRIQAETDTLTKLMNRRAIMSRAGRAFSKARSLGNKLSFLFIDVDNFKNINDTQGHQLGDKVLHDIAQICNSCLRENDIVGRYGGEEFIAVLPGADANNAQVIAERIRARIESTDVTLDGVTVSVTVSIGISQIADQFADMSGMLRAADRALYRAKHEGRNRVIHHAYMLQGDRVKIPFK